MLPLSLVPTLLVLALWCCRARLGLAVLAVVPPCPPCLPCSLLLVVVAVLAMLALLLSCAVLVEDTTICSTKCIEEREYTRRKASGPVKGVHSQSSKDGRTAGGGPRRRTPLHLHLPVCLRPPLTVYWSVMCAHWLIARPNHTLSASATIVLCGSPKSLTLMQERLCSVFKHWLALPSID